MSLELELVSKYYILKGGQVCLSKVCDISELNLVSSIAKHLSHYIDVIGTRISFKILHTQRWSGQFE